MSMFSSLICCVIAGDLQSKNGTKSVRTSRFNLIGAKSHLLGQISDAHFPAHFRHHSKSFVDSILVDVWRWSDLALFCPSFRPCFGLIFGGWLDLAGSERQKSAKTAGKVCTADLFSSCVRISDGSTYILMLKHMGLMASTGAEGGLCDQQIALRAGQRHQRTRRQRKRTSTLNNASCFLFSENTRRTNPLPVSPTLTYSIFFNSEITLETKRFWCACVELSFESESNLRNLYRGRIATSTIVRSHWLFYTTIICSTLFYTTIIHSTFFYTMIIHSTFFYTTIIHSIFFYTMIDFIQQQGRSYPIPLNPLFSQSFLLLLGYMKSILLFMRPIPVESHSIQQQEGDCILSQDRSLIKTFRRF